MNKTNLIFKHEFFHALKKPGFIVMTLIVPVVALLGIGVFKLATTATEPKVREAAVIGYVDEVGIFNNQTDQGLVKLVPYESEEDATRALLSREVAEYILIPEEYVSLGTVRRYTLERELTTPPIRAALIKRFLSVNLLAGRIEPELADRIVSPLDLEVTRLSETGEPAQEQGSFGNIIFPALFSLLLCLALMLGATALISGLGEEKESRLIEVLFSSVSIRQLLVGKILALGLAGLLQVLVWLISMPLLLNLASSTFGGFFSTIQLPSGFLILGIIYFVLGYMLFAVLSVGIGSISSNAQQGSQLAMIYIMLGFVPLWTASLLFNFPNSSVWTALTIFPVTAPIQAMLRLGVADIPLWEILTSIGVLALCIILGLIVTVRVFRMYMLMYGNRPGVGEIMRTLKQV